MRLFLINLVRAFRFFCYFSNILSVFLIDLTQFCNTEVKKRNAKLVNVILDAITHVRANNKQLFFKAIHSSDSTGGLRGMADP